MTNERIVQPVCFLCKHWVGSKIDPVEEGMRRAVLDVEGTLGSIQTGVYRKCKARYIDQEGLEQSFNMGTFGGTKCKATDDKGNKLFDPIE